METKSSQVDTETINETQACIDMQAQEIRNNDRLIRQAVVVIHGIGEQRPMDTLRSFVDAILIKDQKQGSEYLNKPDAMNEMFETRCLQAQPSRQSGRPVTDFYEYYWAHHMRGSKYTHVLGWLLGLMMRNPMSIPHALRPAYTISWCLMLLAAAMWGWGLVSAGAGEDTFVDGLQQQKLLFSGGLLTLLIQWLGSHFVLGYVADAARYFTPSPDNIETRNKIRSEGIKLLHTLHASGKYNRIVIVGHSLGSVIGYDIIRNLWVDLRKPVVPYPQNQPELKLFEHEANKQEEGKATPADIETFQQCQHRLWQEYRKVGIPWLVTDFITLGSPLAHAKLFMADDPNDFEIKKQQYEYPCCPPSKNKHPYYNQKYQITHNGTSAIRSVFIPDHGAPFSCTRWSNLYFPYRRLILGDLIGGPLNGVFGKGIRDIAVTPSSDSFIDHTLVSHIRYWAIGNESGKKISLDALRNVLRLDFLRGKSAKTKPGVTP